MSVEPAADLCRVTLVGIRGRFDVALPASVPLAYLLPTLLRQAGENMADAGVGHGGWALQRLGGWPLDTGQSAAALSIQDGEVLYLRPRRSELPPPVFDDVVEAIGWTLAERTQRWNAAATGLAGLVATGVLLGAGVGVLLLSGPPWHLATATAGLAALLLVLGAGAFSRAVGNAPAATLLGCAAVPYAFLAGVCALLGNDPVTRLRGPALLAGASMALVALLLAIGAVGGGEPAFLGAALVTVVLFVAGAAADHTSAAGVAALALGLVFLAGPMVPGIAYRLARLPAPFLPASAEDLRQASTTLPGAQVTERSLIADRYVTALLAGIALVIAGSVPFLAAAPGWAPSTLAGVSAALALLRTRPFTGRAQRIWLLFAALAATGGFITLLATHLTSRPGRAGLALAALIAAFVVTGLTARPTREPSPPRARLLDIVEIVVAVATVPLVLSVLGVYAYLRSVVG
ncbi:type VII secretion integral membrane protein EccD [Rugosimonospora africana]|uniref:Type VII secretion integral membrane protein EccD n=1 Tax=Rugosimonospora africana TaxID=556532 RepID=A0A8J3QZD1_9ACTN|nr:type VII secretion integral membrane protein EccD [Rugosimonospora africana]GIH18842.1 type VII secretion integral membrane protein EccD [Rugosimonospora africana]